MTTCNDLHAALKNLVEDLEDCGDDRNPESGEPYASCAAARQVLDEYEGPTQSALIQESDTGYVLAPDWQSCWITVDNASVHLWRSQRGLEVEVHRLHQETDEPISSISVSLPELALEE